MGMVAWRLKYLEHFFGKRGGALYKFSFISSSSSISISIIIIYYNIFSETQISIRKISYNDKDKQTINTVDCG